MARRSEFKGIVRNFAHMLNNRNNDHLGYWAMGQLCLLAEQENISSVSINLLEVESNCVENSLDPFAKSMRKLLIKMLNSHKFPHHGLSQPMLLLVSMSNIKSSITIGVQLWAHLT